MTTSGTGAAGANGAELSVITPVYNESDNIEPLLTRLVPVLERCAASFEIIFIDDGSTDDTLKLLRAANHTDSRIRTLSLSRNFGHQERLRLLRRCLRGHELEDGRMAGALGRRHAHGPPGG